MRFKGLDLNLLVVLDTLLTERNVSRTGDRLHLSQSATSGALARLREHFGDDLLVPAGRQLMPTQRALELEPAVRAVLVQIEHRILTKPSFDPGSSRRRFRLMASDYVTIVCLSDALADISARAPHLSFDILPADNDPGLAIDNGRIDLLIMPQPYTSKDQPSEPLFQDSYVCVVAQDNDEVGPSIDFEQFLRMRHVVVQFASMRRPAFEDWFIDRFGETRRVDVVTSSYSMMPFLVVGTRRIAIMHALMARRYSATLPLRIVPSPLEIPNIVEVMQWHAASSEDEALAWVKAELHRSARERGLK